MQQKPIAATAAVLIIVALFASCRGETSVASKSAAAYREAKEKGIAVGTGHDHGGHAPAAGNESSTTTAPDHSTTTGTDHSTMTGTDHSTMTGMNHPPATGHAAMRGMDHSQSGTAAMDHSAMQHGSSGSGTASMSGMDHGSMQHGGSSSAHAGHAMRSTQAATGHSGMQHGAAPAGGSAAHAGHAATQQSAAHSMSGMDHSAMSAPHPQAAHPAQPQATDHAAHAARSNVPPAQRPTGHAGHTPSAATATHAHGAPVVSAPQGIAAAQAIALSPDRFDTPVPIAVAEAAKAAQNIAEPDIRQIVPGTDSENPPTPAPPIRSGSGAAPATGGDHSRHGSGSAPTAPAVDHSQHDASPAATTRTAPRPAPARPATRTIYTCPMHPEVTSPTPGSCPKCGMALVKKNG